MAENGCATSNKSTPQCSTNTLQSHSGFPAQCAGLSNYAQIKASPDNILLL